MRIAIAGFAEASHGGESEEGMALAREVYLKVAATFDELQPQFTYEIRPPEQIGTVEGNDFVEMEQWAARIARDHAAYVVVYGILQPKGEEWEVVPLFYVEPDSFDDAQELVGAQALGKPFLASASGEPAALKRVSEAGNARVQVLVRVVMGLSHYVFGEYEQAFAVFQDAEAIGGWKDDQGKEVLYLLLGNAAGKIAGELLADSACSAGVARQKEIAGAEEHLLQAETYYTAALTLDPKYARAYIGQADVLYLRALLPFARSLDYSQIDTHTLDLAIAGYHRAQKAENQPRLANVAAKVHLGIGGCYLMKAFAEGPEAYKLPAIQEFEAVIEAYGDGAEPLLRERAAESYGRLGRIYASFGPDADQDRVIEYYEKVLSLSRIEKRRAIYACRIRQFESGEDCTCNLGGGEQ